jgi:hypothetical protein
MRRRPRADFPKSCMTRSCRIDVVRGKTEMIVHEIRYVSGLNMLLVQAAVHSCNEHIFS